MLIAQSSDRPRATTLLRKIEWLVVMVTLSLMVGGTRLLYSGGLSISHYSIGEALEGGSRGFQATMLVVYVVAILVLIFQSFPRLVDLVRDNLPVLLFVAFVALSPLWSELPRLGTRRSLAIVGNTLLAFYIVCRFSPEEFLKLLGWAMVLTLAVNLLALVTAPHEIVFDPINNGAFRGVHGHKNDCGQVMVLAAIVFWCLREVDGWRGFPAMMAFAVASALAMLTLSASAWVVYAGLFAVSVPLIRYMRRSKMEPALRLLWVSMGVATVFILLSQFYLVGLEMIGKDPTLTNRTLIWERAADFGWERPWIGAGYGTFWEGWAGRLWIVHGGAIGHAHNAFVDIWLQLGFVGAALMIVPIFILGLRAVGLLIKYRDPFSTFCALIFAYVAAYSWVVKIIPDHRRVVWTVFVACILYASVSLQSLRKKKRVKRRLEEMSASLARGAASRGGGAQV